MQIGATIVHALIENNVFEFKTCAMQHCTSHPVCNLHKCLHLTVNVLKLKYSWLIVIQIIGIKRINNRPLYGKLILMYLKKA